MLRLGLDGLLRGRLMCLWVLFGFLLPTACLLRRLVELVGGFTRRLFIRSWPDSPLNLSGAMLEILLHEVFDQIFRIFLSRHFSPFLGPPDVL